MMESRGMQSKTIKKIIKAKISHWLKHIQNEELKALLKDNIIITGGSITSMLLGEEVKDFDVYLRTREAAKKVAEFYCDEFNKNNPGYTNKLGIKAHAYVLDFQDFEQIRKEIAECSDKAGHVISQDKDRIKIVIRSDGVASERKETLNEPFDDVFDTMKEADQIEVPEESGKAYRPIFLSSNAITLANKVQIVVRFFGEAEEIHKNYDFVHCTNYYDSKTDELVLRKEALEAILAKRLVYTGSKYPICSIIRTRKFIKRGWNIDAGQYLKMAFQVSELNLKDIAVLEDQLVGVDSAYFNMLIHALQEKMKADDKFEINQTYIGTIIDKLF